jgi:hypothetical protein
MEEQMTQKIIILIALMILALSSVIAVENSDAASYLRLGADARSVGMGATGVAFMDNVTAVYVNPAALADAKRIEISTGTTQNMGIDRTMYNAALGFKLPLGYIALSWRNAGVSDFDGFDNNNQPTGSFDNADNNVAASFAFKYHRFNLGITPKLYMSKVADEDKSGWGFDAGMLYHVNRYFNVGLMARDLISDYDGEGTKVPREFTPAVAAFPIPGLVIAAEMYGENDFQDSKLKLGTEYWIGAGDDQEIGSSLSGIRITDNTSWSNVLSKTQAGIRAGLNDGAFSCGFGLRFRMLEFNYAYQMANKDLEINRDNHLYSLVLRF